MADKNSMDEQAKAVAEEAWPTITIKWENGGVAVKTECSDPQNGVHAFICHIAARLAGMANQAVADQMEVTLAEMRKKRASEN